MVSGLFNLLRREDKNFGSGDSIISFPRLFRSFIGVRFQESYETFGVINSRPYQRMRCDGGGRAHQRR